MAGSTTDPMLAAILIAQKINAAIGTNLGPWDVGQLDDATIDAIELLTRPKTALPRAPEIEQRKAEIRAAHPHFTRLTQRR